MNFGPDFQKREFDFSLASNERVSLFFEVVLATIPA